MEENQNPENPRESILASFELDIEKPIVKKPMEFRKIDAFPETVINLGLEDRLMTVLKDFNKIFATPVSASMEWTISYMFITEVLRSMSIRLAEDVYGLKSTIVFPYILFLFSLWFGIPLIDYNAKNVLIAEQINEFNKSTQALTSGIFLEWNEDFEKYRKFLLKRRIFGYKFWIKPHLTWKPALQVKLKVF